jgi:predicted RNA methylase
MRSYKKFYTFPETADYMAMLLNPLSTDIILEPSAGSGNLIKAVKNVFPIASIHAVEINPECFWDLKEFTDVIFIQDFLSYESTEKYDCCIANPPWGNGIKIEDHYNKICSLVCSGGRVVMIVPKEFYPNVNYVEYDLQNWSKNSDGTVTEIKIITFLNK